MGALRSFDCPETGERCADRHCSLSYCHERERTAQAEANRKTDKAHIESQHENDRRAAAWLVLKALIAEQNEERRMSGQPLLRIPRARQKEELIAKILTSPRQVQRLQHQIDALRKQRESRIGPRAEQLPDIPSAFSRAEQERLRQTIEAFPEAERASLWEQIKKAYPFLF